MAWGHWVWAEWLSIYHAIFSITIPIFLAELTIPKTRSRIWLSTRLRVFFHGLLVVAIILGVSAPIVFCFLFTSALIPVAIVTMIVGAVLVLGYEKLLGRWAKKGFNDSQKLGLIMGALGFWAIFFDPILELLGRLGTSVLGGIFIAYLLWLRKRTTLRLARASSPAEAGVALPKLAAPSVR